MKLRITVDHSVCVGNAMCVSMVPEVFVHNADRQSTVHDPAGAPTEDVVAAAANCPVSAIRVEDAATGDVLFP